MRAAVSFRREMMDGVLREAGPGRRDAFIPSSALQNHAASLARLPGGELACVWFGGTMEGMPDISVHMSVLDEAAGRWSPAEKLVDDPARSEQNPLLHTAADGSVWLLYTSQTSGNQETSVVRRRVSHDGGRSFGAPHTLIDVPGTFIRQRIVTLASGEMLLPVFQCRKLAGESWTGNRDTSAVFRSADGGRTWTEIPVPGSLGQVHMNIVPLGGGRMLALFRSRWADFIHRSRSEDSGASWSAAAPTDLPNNNSSIQSIRLADGRLALVYNHSSAANAEGRRSSLYDEIEGGDTPPAAATTGRQAFWGAPRSPMSLVFSEDGGETWSGRRDLETGDGYCLSNNSVDSINREFSYPTVLEAPGGQLDIAFTYFRQGIKHVRLSI
jgi:predicted neuraminidase